MKSTLLVLLSIPFFFACGTSKTDATVGDKMAEDLSEITLVLVELTNDDKHYEAQKNVITLRVYVDRGEYSGKSGCNNYAGKVDVRDKNKLHFYPGALTKMMCDDEKMKWENRYLSALIGHDFIIESQKSQIVFTNAAYKSSLTFQKGKK